MEIKIAGQSIRVELALLFLVVGVILGCHVLCSCSRVSVKEGLTMLNPADKDYILGKGVPNDTWDTKPQGKGPSVDYRKQDHSTYTGTPVPLPSGQLFMFADNEFKPECCGSTFSNANGCACITKDQIEYINQRGGNRTLSSEF
uniref:Uncharacterized protein n=1 Tax=viral metagenome TaxID=1070528 RepID=A0A6C0KEX5_9ZZZZ